MFGRFVMHATPGADHRVALTFDDGLEAEVDLAPLLGQYEGVFAPLREESHFRQLRVDPEAGTLCWPNGADLCPDVLYALASGQPIRAGETIVFPLI